MPFKVGRVEFRYDGIIYMCALALIFFLCTVYSTHYVSRSGSETHRLLSQTNALLTQDLLERAKDDSVIGDRLALIESKQRDHMAQMEEMSHLLVTLENEISETKTHGKASATTK